MHMLQLQIIGVYIEPTFYTKITSKSNEIILKSQQKKKKVVSEDVSCILKQLLTEPVTGNSRNCYILLN